MTMGKVSTVSDRIAALPAEKAAAVQSRVDTMQAWVDATRATIAQQFIDQSAQALADFDARMSAELATRTQRLIDAEEAQA